MKAKTNRKMTRKGNKIKEKWVKKKTNKKGLNIEPKEAEIKRRGIKENKYINKGMNKMKQ